MAFKRIPSEIARQFFVEFPRKFADEWEQHPYRLVATFVIVTVTNLSIWISEIITHA